MCETGEDEVGPSLQLAQKNYAEMLTRKKLEAPPAPAEPGVHKWLELNERIVKLEHFMADVKRGRMW